MSMQFSNFDISKSGLSISLINIIPIEFVKRLIYYTENSSGTFDKKEFRWSFNNIHWSSWEILNQGNFTNINTDNKKYLYFNFRFIQSTSDSGDVSTITINYDRLSDKEILTLFTVVHVSPVIDNPNTTIVKTNADLLDNHNPDYYLTRQNHTGSQAIGTVDGLKQILYNLTNGINNGIQSGANEDLSGIGTFSRKEDQNLVFKTLYSPNGNVIITEDVSGQINFDVSISITDASVNELFNWNLSQDASIVRIDTYNAIQDASILLGGGGATAYDIIQDVSINISATGAWNGLTKTDSSIGLGGQVSSNILIYAIGTEPSSATSFIYESSINYDDPFWGGGYVINKIDDFFGFTQDWSTGISTKVGFLDVNPETSYPRVFKQPEIYYRAADNKETRLWMDNDEAILSYWFDYTDETLLYSKLRVHSAGIELKYENTVSNTLAWLTMSSSSYSNSFIKDGSTINLSFTMADGGVFSDSRTVSDGLKYLVDYSDNFVDLSLVNKKWVDDNLTIRDSSIIRLDAYNAIQDVSILSNDVSISNLYTKGIWDKSGNDIYYLDGSVGINTSTPSATLDVSGNINARELFNSNGILKIQPDVQGDVELFGDTSVGDTTDGREFIIRRQAAEGDTSLRIYINEWKDAIINGSSNLTFQAGSSLLYDAAASVRWRYSGASKLRLDMSDNATLKQYGLITAAAGDKYIQWQVDDATDQFVLDREDASILGFKINMPLEVDGSVGIGTSNPSHSLDVSGNINTSEKYLINSVDYNAIQDTSISLNINEINQLDASIVRLDNYNAIQDVSISLGGGDVNKAYVDASLGERDTSLNVIFAYDAIQDVSIALNSNFIPIIEMSDVNITIDSSWNNYFIKLNPTTDASVSFDQTTEGVNLTFENETANTIYFYSGVGAPTLKSKDSAVTLADQYGMVTCIMDGSSWYLSGDLT